MSRLIATVYLRGQGVNKVVPTGPGRSLQFRGGAAAVTDERDMPTALSMAGVQVAVEPQWIDFAGAWAQKCPINTPAVAQVIVSGADADTILVGDAPDYLVLRPDAARIAPVVDEEPGPPDRYADPRWVGKPRRRLAAAAE